MRIVEALEPQFVALANRFHRTVKDPSSEPADLVQAGYVLVMQLHDSSRCATEQELRATAYRSFLNLCRDWGRQARRSRNRMHPLPVEDLSIERASYIDLLMSRAIREAVEQLDEAERRLLHELMEPSDAVMNAAVERGRGNRTRKHSGLALKDVVRGIGISRAEASRTMSSIRRKFTKAGLAPASRRPEGR